MTYKVSATELNAFVDGELPPSEAAKIAALVATQPGLAGRVAQLHQIKAALSEMPDTLTLPQTPQPEAATRGRFQGFRLAIACSVAALSLLWTAPLSMPGQQESSSSFSHQHDHWVATGQTLIQPVIPELFAWLKPVTQASGLTLVHHANDGLVQHFGFKGKNDCRLSLFVTKATGPVTPLRLSLTDQVQQAHWQHDKTRFEMIARDMAPARFATVATGLHRDSQAFSADDGLHIALYHAARLPCAA